MKSPILRELRPEFDERNLWLQLWLGALSLCDELDDALARLPEAAPASADAKHPDDLFAWLGLIALRNQIRLHAAVAGSASDEGRAPNEDTTSPQSAALTMSELLR